MYCLFKQSGAKVTPEQIKQAATDEKTKLDFSLNPEDSTEVNKMIEEKPALKTEENVGEMNKNQAQEQKEVKNLPDKKV